MAALATSSALYILVDAGFNVIGPLWATRDLGLANADWAWLRSVSEFGGFISILAFGILAEHLGARWMAALGLVGVGVTLAGLGIGADTVSLMAVLGTFTSIIYVSYNTLAQCVSSRRPAVANTIYRAAGAVAAIVAPTLATQAAQEFGSHAPVLMAASVVLGIAGLAIVWYPDPESVRPGSRPLSATLALYRRCFALPSLLTFVAVTRGFGIAVAAVGAFAALRFTRELALGEPAFGLLCSIIAVGNLIALLVSGWIVKRLGSCRTLALAWTGCSLAAVVLGLTDSLMIAIAAYAVFVPLHAMCSVPLSLCSGLIVEDAGPDGPSQNAVFAVQKLFQSGMTMLAMAALGALEPLVGMSALISGGGLLGLPMALIMYSARR